MRKFRRCNWCQHHNLEKTDFEIFVDMQKAYIRMGVIKKTTDTIGGSDKAEFEEFQKWRKSYTINQQCSFCGATRWPLRQDIHKDLADDSFQGEYLKEGVLEDVITYAYKVWDEYKVFMGDEGKHLPEDIIIKQVAPEDKDSYKGRCDYDENLKKWVITLNANDFFFFHDLRRILFHEFAHIFNHIDKETGVLKKRISGDVWYGEFYASEIEMMSMLGFKHINDERKITLKKKLVDKCYTKTLLQFLIDEQNDKLTSVKYEQELAKGITFDLVVSVVRAIMYQRGKANFVKKYVDESEIDKIPTSEIFEDFARNHFEDDDGKFASLLDDINLHFTKPLHEIDEDYFNKTMSNMLYILLYCNVPEYKSQKHLLQLKMRS